VPQAAAEEYSFETPSLKMDATTKRKIASDKPHTNTTAAQRAVEMMKFPYLPSSRK
jgi:hypothetical protein